jgi:hypothetical protein
MGDPPVNAAKAASRVSVWLLKLWLVYGAWCACTGWILSALGWLTGTGYAVTAVITLIVGGLMGPKHLPRLPSIRPRDFRPRFRRFRRPLPLIYLLLLAGSLAGGIIHPPNNYDMLTYRLPRVLYWLADGRWNWIRGSIDRMNYSGTGFEWSSLPLLLLARGTRPFFLLNIVTYLLLPGMTFAVMRQLGVGRRTAWWWMWLVPSGLNFVMQAGGGGNDTIGVVYLLASLYFAWGARKHRRTADAWWSLIAVALLSATKTSNLPAVLPCVVALIPAIRLIKRAPAATAAVLLVAALCSAGPILFLNWRHTGDITGSPGDPGRLKVHNPVAGVGGNTLEMLSTNLQPPVVPWAGKWNSTAERHIPAAVARMLDRDFPRFSLHVGELPQEESAGIGLGISVMAAVSLIATAAALCRGQRPRPADPWRWPVLLAGLAALLVLMATLGSESAARLASPYYIFLIVPLLVHPVNGRLVRRRWWQALAVLASLMVVPGLVLTPSRPLFPAVRWTAEFASRHPRSAIAARAALVYLVYSQRSDDLAPLRKFLPAEARVVGVIAGLDGCETSLWQPLSDHRVVELLPDDTAESARSRGVSYVVLGPEGLEEQDATVDKFDQKFRATVVGHERITVKISRGAEDWYVVRLDP